MIDLAIPGFGELRLSTLVCDYNGTLAQDGLLLGEVRARLLRVTDRLRVKFVTGDTFGTAQEQLRGFPAELIVLPAEGQGEAKRKLVADLGAHAVVAIGNGRNDRLMLAAAALGIGVVGAEGIATEALQAADVVVRDITDAFDLLLDTRRLVATLRS
jgi:P-type E1-E2 ATPase